MIFVTCASGNVGREVVRALAERGLPASTARIDFRDPSTFARVEGARALFLMRPPSISDVRSTLLPFVDEARRRGVRHVVFLSVAGADTNPIVPHHAVERHLMRGDDWTILRPGFFAQNFGDAYRRDVVEDARVYVPAGRGLVAFVDARDLGDVAGAIFAAPEQHARRGYVLTGGVAVSFTEAARTLSDVLGRSIRYEPASIVGYARHLHRRGLPAAQIAVQTILHVGLRFGQAEVVDPTLARLLGRAPHTLRSYFEASRALWLSGS